MKPEDICELTGVADPRVSPDGRTVAFVVWRVDKDANEYKSNIWLMPTDGSQQARQLTFGDRRDAQPRWSPDGSRVAFTSNRGDKVMQLYVMPLTGGGEARKLTTLKEDVGQAAWSPDGSRIAFASRVRADYYDIEDEKKRPPRRITRLFYKLDNEGWTADRRHHIFIVATDGSSQPVQVTSGDYEDGSPTWSPDGSKLAFISARHEDWDIVPVLDVYAVPATGGEPIRLTTATGLCDSPSWSPDGSKIALHYAHGVWESARHRQIAVIPATGGEPAPLTTSLDRNCGPYPEIREPIWMGSDLLFAAEDRGNTHLYRVSANGAGKPEIVVSGELCVTGYDASAGVIVHTATNPTSLSELYAGDRRLTHVGRSFTDARALCAPERFTVVSPDGSKVDAWFIRPAGFEQGKKYPLLLNIHGGPFTQYGNRFFDEFQVYAAAGYAVVFSNPRGSSGYSEAWGRAIGGPVEGGPGWGSVDYEDVMAVVDEAIRRFDFVDTNRLGVMGGSYGGYMTSWIVGHTDRFRVAISERAVNDILSEGGASDISIWWKAITGAHYWEQPEVMRRISPATYAKNIKTPLLIMHSENDLRCPIGQGEDLFTRLRVLKREVEFVRFPAESHELSRSGSPYHRIKRFEVILDWLGRYLKSSSS
jgi:dipeptidyl aminopeptidase/acylaminoacyl peptidase